MALLLDAGALIAVDRRDRNVRSLLSLARKERVPIRTTAPVVAQVWRDGRRQANLARVLASVEVLSFDRRHARRAGELLGLTRSTDAVDAHLVLVAEPGDRILTSDAEDIGRLLAARGVEATVVGV